MNFSLKLATTLIGSSFVILKNTKFLFILTLATSVFSTLITKALGQNIDSLGTCSCTCAVGSTVYSATVSNNVTYGSCLLFKPALCNTGQKAPGVNAALVLGDYKCSFSRYYIFPN